MSKVSQKIFIFSESSQDFKNLNELSNFDIKQSSEANQLDNFKPDLIIVDVMLWENSNLKKEITSYLDNHETVKICFTSNLKVNEKEANLIAPIFTQGWKNPSVFIDFLNKDNTPVFDITQLFFIKNKKLLRPQDLKELTSIPRIFLPLLLISLKENFFSGNLLLTTPKNQKINLEFSDGSCSNFTSKLISGKHEIYNVAIHEKQIKLNSLKSETLIDLKKMKKIWISKVSVSWLKSNFYFLFNSTLIIEEGSLTPMLKILTTDKTTLKDFFETKTLDKGIIREIFWLLTTGQAHLSSCNLQSYFSQKYPVYKKIKTSCFSMENKLFSQKNKIKYFLPKIKNRIQELKKYISPETSLPIEGLYQKLDLILEFGLDLVQKEEEEENHMTQISNTVLSFLFEKKYLEAIEILKSIKPKDQTPLSKLFLIWAYFKVDQSEKAEQLFSKISEKNYPDDVIYNFVAALSFSYKKKNSQAKAYLGRSISLGQGFLPAKEELSNLNTFSFFSPSIIKKIGFSSLIFCILTYVFFLSTQNSDKEPSRTLSSISTLSEETFFSTMGFKISSLSNETLSQTGSSNYQISNEQSILRVESGTKKFLKKFVSETLNEYISKNKDSLLSSKEHKGHTILMSTWSSVFTSEVNSDFFELSSGKKIIVFSGRKINSGENLLVTWTLIINEKESLEKFKDIDFDFSKFSH